MIPESFIHSCIHAFIHTTRFIEHLVYLRYFRCIISVTKQLRPMIPKDKTGCMHVAVWWSVCVSTLAPSGAWPIRTWVRGGEEKTLQEQEQAQPPFQPRPSCICQQLG